MPRQNKHELTDDLTSDQLAELAEAGKLERIGSPLGGAIIANEDELRAVFSGRPSLGHTRATGQGRSPRRQVRLPQALNARLEVYTTAHQITASDFIREAVNAALNKAENPGGMSRIG